ncbi:ABC transporter permease [Paenibacillus sp. 32O-W]|jgi:ABC-type sugar transport systems, permease components|uniref:ABC transporter permease n=2 Tax=Paenibacillus TaxID=44249 RepID=A0ABQ4NAZ3_9BACL|nr:ABC transporter permease [Paenibacillus sp. 32O-W]GIQ65400.1 ABC transporter permease [Paenibacillus cisolokensis]
MSSKAEIRPLPKTRTPGAAFGFGSKWTRSIKETARNAWKWRLSYLFIAPFYLMFLSFILIPIVAGVLLGFTYFNAIQFPTWVGWMNYQNLFSQDIIFLQHVVPNSFKFALFVGPIGYIASFLLAWLIAQLPGLLRTWFALAIYAPSLTAGIAMTVVWQVMFTGDRTGYLNSFLLKWGLIEKPVLFTQSSEFLMTIMIIVSIWSSMGIGFLAILAGILNVDKQMYEAGRIDGISSRLQEIWYITIPLMKPQMMFAAIMSIVYTLKAGAIGTQLSGSNPTPNYAGQLMINHIEDYGFIRYELGYASAISVVLLVVCYALSRFFGYLFAPKEGE